MSHVTPASGARLGLEDRAEIIDLITRYTRAVDTREWAALRTVFTEDAVLDYSSVDGPVARLDEAIGWIEQGLAGFERYQHIIGQVAIEATDGGATATAYFTNPLVARGPDGRDVVWEVGGYYHHQLRRTPDGWRSVGMVDDVVWQRGF